MFTGLIEQVGEVESARQTDAGRELRVRAPFTDLASGESIAVNGACLTVVAFDGDGFEADASNETLALTTLGALPVGAALNLERAMRADDRLGGHLVSGHVDGVGHVLRIEPDARAQRWRFAAPRPLLRYVAQKGSICVNGASLTVNAVDDAGFEVALVPHTLAHTAFSRTAVGDAVNLEVDLVARYVERLLTTREQA